MKKIFRLFAAFAATTMAFSCMEEANPETGVQNGGSKFEGPMVTLTFSVDDLTKTSYDKENGHQWSEGDQIKIIYGTEDDAFTVADVIDGTVTATVGDVDTYYAVYPATAEHMFSIPADATEARFSVRIPRNQDGAFETANLMSAETTKAEHSFDFKNLTHIIKFDLAAGHGFEAIEFCANSEEIITGRYFVDITDDGVEMEYNNVGNTNSKYITVSKLADKSGEFYVGLLPDVDMSTGIVLRGKKTDEDWKYYAISKTALATTRSTITKIGAVNSYLRENVWYITEDGQGDGSQTNPAGISKLIELMNKIKLSDGSSTKSMHQWRLNNAVINIAAGTYNIPEANDNKTFEPNGLTQYTDVTLKGEEGTVFTTIATSNVRIFRFNNVGNIGKLTFDGITFQGTDETGVSSVGVGTYFSGTSAGTVAYNNCTFTKFNNTNTGSKGAVILCAGDGKREVNFSGCTFEENDSVSEGIVTNTASNTTINFAGCTFKNNTAKCGAALYISNGAVAFEDCDFVSNTATNGAVVYTNGGTVTLADGCTFTSNSATQNGGVIYAVAGTTNVDGCTFTSNSAAANGGTVYLEVSDVSISLNDCDFSKNSAKIGGVAYCTKGTQSFNGCTFLENTASSYGATLANSVGVLIVDGCSFSKNTITTDGGAIFSYGETPGSSNVTLIEGKTNTYVYNTLFDENTATSQGSAIKIHGNTNLVVVNSTFTKGTANNGTIRLRAQNSNATAIPNVKAWIISCTFSGNNKFSLYNQSSTAYIYNCVLNDPTSFNANQLAGSTTFGKSILYNDSYFNVASGTLSGKAAPSTLTDKTTLESTVVGDFANDTYPVTGAALTSGMSLAELSALATTITAEMPLFDATKLTVDQKGNSREGKTVMGAYVGQ